MDNMPILDFLNSNSGLFSCTATVLTAIVGVLQYFGQKKAEKMATIRYKPQIVLEFYCANVVKEGLRCTVCLFNKGGLLNLLKFKYCKYLDIRGFILPMRWETNQSITIPLSESIIKIPSKFYMELTVRNEIEKEHTIAIFKDKKNRLIVSKPSVLTKIQYNVLWKK